MDNFRHLIGGELVRGEGTLGVHNPATGKVVVQAPMAGRAELESAVGAARGAWEAWRGTSFAERKKVVLGLVSCIAEHRDELASLLVLEQGKPRDNAEGEVLGTQRFGQVTANLTLEPSLIRDDAAARIEVHYRPMGVVGGIAPWNYPLLLGFWKVFSALMAGNTIVLKPSPYTPLATLKAAEYCRNAVPPGVLNVVCGGDQFGQMLVEHPGVDHISFTGSTETGKKIVAAAAPTLKRLTLELGGNDAAIVLPDVNVREIAPKLFKSAFNNSGQICMATKRLYVHDDVYDEMCQVLVELAEQATVGPGDEPATTFGPVQNQAQYDRVRKLIDGAVDAKARVIAGGGLDNRPGYFVPVTLVADVAEGVDLVDEEPFGPVLPILRFKDVDEAIRRANASSFGLGGSIWTRDLVRGAELASRLECGTAWVNQHSVILPDVPFGGAKSSGWGVQGGSEGLRHLCQEQVVNIAKV